MNEGSAHKIYPSSRRLIYIALQHCITAGPHISIRYLQSTRLELLAAAGTHVHTFLATLGYMPASRKGYAAIDTTWPRARIERRSMKKFVNGTLLPRG
jgi:hypothetical protein